MLTDINSFERYAPQLVRQELIVLSGSMVSEATKARKEDSSYWRWRIFIAIYVGYFFYYLSRKALPCLAPMVVDELMLNKTDFGLINSWHAIAYGISKVISGMISDRTSPRLFMSLGLALVGVSNLALSRCSSLPQLAIFWALNGYLQGWGWPPCGRLLTHWFGAHERGWWWALWNTSPGFGGASAPLLITTLSDYLPWRSVLIASGLTAIAVSGWIYNRLSNIPSGSTTAEESQEGNTSSLWAVLNIKSLWVLSFACLAIHVVRQGMADWLIIYLKEQRSYPYSRACRATSMFEIGGICGSLASGSLSDTLFAGRREPILQPFSLLLIFALLWLQLADWRSELWAIFMIGFASLGTHMLIVLTAAERADPSAVGTSTGLVGLGASIGAACAGIPLATAIQSYGWNSFFTISLGCALTTSLTLLFA